MYPWLWALAAATEAAKVEINMDKHLIVIPDILFPHNVEVPAILCRLWMVIVFNIGCGEKKCGAELR